MKIESYVWHEKWETPCKPSIKAEADAIFFGPAEFNTHCYVFREVIFLDSQKSAIVPTKIIIIH